ncbi:hypothetical protein MAM1_0085d04710 [Mucor ambiguus]|uniref:Uncharacterized protein n=1 Tax=Mucor ambiguus TaxID=91626 RepID=A0A0C9M677_9FUNG|nr:hypothetical protein MAM1_0085d04710 [Mucor ambiguus]
MGSYNDEDDDSIATKAGTLKKKRIDDDEYMDQDQQDEQEGSKSDQDTDPNQLIHQKLDITLGKLQTMTQEITQLVSQVGDLKSEMQAIKLSISNSKYAITDDFSNSTSNEGSTVDSPIQSAQIPKKGHISTAFTEENVANGPFPKYEPIDRVVPRPSSKELTNSIGGKSHSLQFTCNLYVDLITKILGPSSKTGLDYKAMVKEAILITKAVLSHIKEVNNIDPDLRWSRLDPTIKLDAYRKLEAATEHLLPLKVCSEFWGAHVLISNFWLKRKKKNSSSDKSNAAYTLAPHRKNPSITSYIDTDIHTPPSTLPPISQDSTSTVSTTQQNAKRQKPKAFSIPFLTHQ